jgi:TolA-binding protein
MNCARFVEPEAAERYVLGQMTEAEQSAFEEHYFACDDCFDAVRALQDLQTVLRTPDAVVASRDDASAAEVPSSVTSSSRAVTGAPMASEQRPIPFERRPTSSSPTRFESGPFESGRRTSRMPIIYWTIAAAASVLIGLAVWQRQSTSIESPAVIARNAPPPATEQPPAAAPAPPSTTPAGGGGSPAASTPATSPSGGAPATRPPLDLTLLALVTPPSYVPLQTRGAEATPQIETFQAAMAHYAAKDYAAAVAGLRPVADANPADGRAQFFLGVSALMTGDNATATAALDRAVASGVAPFAGESHFYLGKAALRDRDLARAERELTLAVQQEAGPSGEAARILRTLRQAGQSRN